MEPRYEVYNKDPTMILDRKEWQVFGVQRAPSRHDLADEDPELCWFVEKLVRLLNEEEAREYVRSIP